MNHRLHVHAHHHEECEDEISVCFQPLFVFDNSFLGEEVPEGFNCARIVLDGTIKSDLAWKNEQEAAANYISKGLKIFWEIDLGLSHVKLNNQTQFSSLSLSLEHFRDGIWERFHQHTAGICLYRGSLDFSRNFLWDDEQQSNLQSWLEDLFGNIESFGRETGLLLTSFSEITHGQLVKSPRGCCLVSLFCRDVVGDYLDLLANRLPDSINTYLLFDGEEVESKVLTALLLTKERYPRFIIGFKGDSRLGGELAWEGERLSHGVLAKKIGNSSIEHKPTYGICLPSISVCRPSDIEGLEKIFCYLIDKRINFRVIPEAALNAEWDGLDYLFVYSAGVSQQGRRKLQGFAAAGGVVVYSGASLGITGEINITDLK